MDDEAGAHAAGFEGHVEGAAGQPVVGGGRRGHADGDHLGMGAGVVAGDRLVETTPDDLTVLHQHRAHRHFAQGRALGGQGQGFTHEFAITAAVDDGGGTNLTHHATSMAAIRPVSMWSITWQWNIQTPGLSATSATCARSFLPSR
ncbi:hypothetical protein D9M73_152520 [compost metagenome]